MGNLHPGRTEQDQALDEWLFRRTFEDLEDRVRPGADLSRYRLLGCSILLRKLIMDGGVSLAKKVASGRGMKAPSFRAHKMRLDEEYLPELAAHGISREMWDAGPVFHGDGIVPGNDNTQVVTLSFDSWPKHVTGQVGGQKIEVRDMIDFVCRVDGGAHAGRVRNPLEKQLRALSPYFLGPDIPGQVLRGSPAGCLIGISRVSIDGLRPLYEVTEG